MVEQDSNKIRPKIGAIFVGISRFAEVKSEWIFGENALLNIGIQIINF